MTKYITFGNMTETQQAEYDAMDIEEQLAYDTKLLEQEVKAYVKEYNRLSAKHGDNRTITAESVTGKPYFYDDDSDSFMWSGGKHMAQYTGYNEGAWGADEVKMWEE